MQAREGEGPEAEEGDGGEGFEPAGVGGGGDDAEAQVDGVAGLHGDEGAPDVDGGGVEEARDEVAGQEDQVGILAAQRAGEVVVQAVG